MPAVCRFAFPHGVGREVVEAQLALAIIAAECTFGQPKVRINAAYCVSPASKAAQGNRKLQAVIDISTEVGEHIAQVFTGLMIRQLGEDNFVVERVTKEGDAI
jgi:hypothetical protein